MSLLARPGVASFAAKSIQCLAVAADRRPNRRGSAAASHSRFPEFPRSVGELAVPISVAPARVVVYLPTSEGPPSPVHVNFHGGGYVMSLTETDDPLCRFLAAEAGVAVVNVDYVVAPQHPFPAPPRQAFEVVRWIAEHGGEHGWDGSRPSVGGQSAGGGLAAAVARQALEEGGPGIALQVLTTRRWSSRRAPGASAPPSPNRCCAPGWERSSTARTSRTRASAPTGRCPQRAADTADPKGIAPALLVTAEYDLLKAEAVRYAERLRRAGTLVEHHDVLGVDHGYDGKDDKKALETYAVIARHV
ncbi:alpha/beta hydrolase fold domain-containing protein [Streptomyces mirabilis]|uniref:alpha/beta hydrolase fold domain-containing protein n=1 Tax=Streptomyces mirabilis TaxID=68239 RepID=UPI00368AE21A